MGELEGKVAVITGAGSGMGKASVKVFVREGASVVAADISGAEVTTAHEAVAEHGEVPVLGGGHPGNRGLVVDGRGHRSVRGEPLERGELAIGEDPEQVDDRGPIVGVGVQRGGRWAQFSHSEQRLAAASR